MVPVLVPVPLPCTLWVGAATPVGAAARQLRRQAQGGAQGSWLSVGLVAAGAAAALGGRRRRGTRPAAATSPPSPLARAAVANPAAATTGGGATAGEEDRLVRYLDADGLVSVRAMTATNLVRDACLRHGCSPIASLALGRALMGTVLLADGRDEGETLQLRLQGGGPCGSIIAEASASLHCRGFVAEPGAEAASVPELVGFGEGATLRVTRTHPFWKSPYTGTSEMKSGEIAEDIVQYLAVSEQTPASMGLSVEWDPEAGCVKHAEGWLVTLLPGWDEARVNVVEANIANFGRMQVRPGLPRPEAICEHMMRELVGSFQVEGRLKWRCTCSEQRLLTALMMLGKTEVLRILKEKEDVSAKCDWCGRSLSLTPEQIREHLLTDEGRNEVETRSSSPRGLKIDEEQMQQAPEPGTASWG